MMAGKGGYQAPRNPAPSSPPGALSKRTDGGPGAMQGAKYMSGLPYGEGQEFQSVQQMAPMSAAAPAPSASSVGSAPARSASRGAPLTPLGADTTRPSEPVTAGVASGPGAGREVLPMNVKAENPLSLASSLQPLLQHDTTGDIALLYRLAVNRGW